MTYLPLARLFDGTYVSVRIELFERERKKKSRVTEDGKEKGEGVKNGVKRRQNNFIGGRTRNSKFVVYTVSKNPSDILSFVSKAFFEARREKQKLSALLDLSRRLLRSIFHLFFQDFVFVSFP